MRVRSPVWRLPFLILVAIGSIMAASCGDGSSPEATSSTVATTPVTSGATTVAPAPAELPRTACCDGTELEAGVYALPDYWGVPLTVQIGAEWRSIYDNSAALVAFVQGQNQADDPSRWLYLIRAPAELTPEEVISAMAAMESINLTTDPQPVEIADFAGLQFDASAKHDPEQAEVPANGIEAGAIRLEALNDTGYFPAGFFVTSATREIFIAIRRARNGRAHHARTDRCSARRIRRLLRRGHRGTGLAFDATGTLNHPGMKAIVQNRYGSADVYELREVDKPRPRDDEVLVRVRAASVHPDVWHMMTGRPYFLRLLGAGLTRPKQPIPGTDFAGEVDSVGGRVTRFRVGDPVFGESASGHQWQNAGTYAEYAAVPQTALALKPTRLSFEQAAAVPTSGLIAMQGVRYQGRVEPGQKVLVNGAGGGVGVFAVQIAKAHGAEVTAVDSTHKLEMLQEIGADHVIDHTQEDFTRSGEHYDLIVDIPGNHTYSDCRRAMSPQGRYVLIGHDGFGSYRGRWAGSMGHFIRGALLTPFVSQSLSPRIVRNGEHPLLALIEMIEDGKLTPVVDRSFRLSQLPEALRHLESGQAMGKVVLTI